MAAAHEPLLTPEGGAAMSKVPKPNSWYRGVLALVMVGAVLASQAWEQYTQGQNATPQLLGSLCQLVLAGVFTVEGVAQVAEAVTKSKEAQNGKDSQ